MHRAHMLNVHRARLLAGSRAAPPAEEESGVLCVIVASVTSLMLLCGVLSVVPSPRAFGVAKTHIIVGAGSVMLLLMLVFWVGTAWIEAARRRVPTAAAAPGPAPTPPAPVRLALRQMCACGLADAAALRTLPAFAYEPPAPPPSGAADEGGEPAPALCAVCLEDVRAGEMVRKLPACGHLFHVCCVDVWLRSHRTCPICRCELQPRTVVATKSTVAMSASTFLPV